MQYVESYDKVFRETSVWHNANGNQKFDEFRFDYDFKSVQINTRYFLNVMDGIRFHTYGPKLDRDDPTLLKPHIYLVAQAINTLRMLIDELPPMRDKAREAAKPHIPWEKLYELALHSPMNLRPIFMHLNELLSIHYPYSLEIKMEDKRPRSCGFCNFFGKSAEDSTEMGPLMPVNHTNSMK